MSSRVRIVEVAEDHAGRRLDNFLRQQLKGVPKSRLYRAIRSGEVRVNKGRAGADYRLRPGDRVRLPPLATREPPEGAPVLPRYRNLLETALLYEDSGLWVIDKPAGLAVHGGSGLRGGLIENLRRLRPREKFLELVHRLDRDTSGCVLIARRRSVLRHLHAELREDRVDKRYQALVAGRWPARRTAVEAPLKRNVLRGGERVVRVDPEGKSARTEFRVLRRFPECTLVEARPVTGRTHQLRVHCREAGHPILGDERYGAREGNRWAAALGLRRLFLHAAFLGFESAAGERIEVEAPLDPMLERFLTKLDN